jgi:hypothetical protein
MKIEAFIEERNGIKVRGWRISNEVPPGLVKYLLRRDEEFGKAADKELSDHLGLIRGDLDDLASE